MTPFSIKSSASGLHCDKAVLKCSLNQVKVSEETRFFPETCAADDENFSITGSASPSRISSFSRLKPGMSNGMEPKVSHSGISAEAYKSIKFPGDPCA
ncbi:hypothetical protein D3C85_793160 [compost metagenome]